MVVLIDENFNRYKTYTFKVSDDVTSIIIKNSEKFSYLTVSLNTLAFELVLSSANFFPAC